MKLCTSGVECADEVLLHPAPYPSRATWCRAPLRGGGRPPGGDPGGSPHDPHQSLITFRSAASWPWLPATPRFSILDADPAAGGHRGSLPTPLPPPARLRTLAPAPAASVTGMRDTTVCLLLAAHATGPVSASCSI